MADAKECIWISWYPHRRTFGLCEAWGIPLHVIESPYSGVRKWLAQSRDTWRQIRDRRPRILFVQNPSLGLTMLGVALRPLYGYRLVVDAHNEGVRPFIRDNLFIRWLTRQLLEAADVTIVTNSALASDVNSAGGHAIILPDPLPDPPAEVFEPEIRSNQAYDVVVISTFAPDEPIEDILKAAAAMPELLFAMTGDPGKLIARGVAVPPNLRLTGFLPDAEYWRLLADAAIVCDLTLMPDCLVCGAYEGLALGRPMVLSDNPATRELFGEAAMFAGEGTASIVQAIRSALDHHTRLETNSRRARDEFRERWLALAHEGWSVIGHSRNSASAVKPRGAGT